ncbi:MAG: hypothetical protein GYB31_04730 [Bacteroidetes bacterium]|nr:hypothetical protein [Bacteroidota bacterium]
MMKYLASNDLKFALFCCLILLSACNKDELQAEQSLQGEWKVTEITSYYGDFDQNSFNPSQVVNDTTASGYFLFSEEMAEYNFSRNDTVYSGTASWDLALESVNEGFFKVNDFTLSINGYFMFDVTFGDETKNAEKNATRIFLRELKEEDSYEFFFDMSLEKK